MVQETSKRGVFVYHGIDGIGGASGLPDSQHRKLLRPQYLNPEGLRKLAPGS